MTNFNYTMPNTLSSSAAANIKEFGRLNPGFNGKIRAADQRKLVGDAVFGKKTVQFRGRGVIRVYMTINPRGDELMEVFISETGRVYEVCGDWWNGKEVPKVDDWWWSI